MGCVCCSLSSFVSIILDALERISLCTVCAMLTCCLLFTIISMMVLGIGIGFHYCFVQNSVDAMAKAAKATGVGRRSGGGEAGVPGGVIRSLDTAVRRFGARSERARRDAEPPLPADFAQGNADLTQGNVDLTQENLNLTDIQEAPKYDAKPKLNENERSRREAQPAESVNDRIQSNFLSPIRPISNPQGNHLNLSHIQNHPVKPSPNQTLTEDALHYANLTMNISAVGPIPNPVLV